MITTLLVLMLMSALLVGFTTVVMSDQRYRFIDRDRGQAFYAASGGDGEAHRRPRQPVSQERRADHRPGHRPDDDSQPAEPQRGVIYGASIRPAALPASELSSLYCYSTPANRSAPRGEPGGDDGRHQRVHDHLLRKHGDHQPDYRPRSRDHQIGRLREG